MIDQPITECVSDAPFLFDGIVAKIKPAQDSFRIELATGDTLRFRHILGRDAFRQIREASHRFAEGVTPLNAPPEMKPYVDTDRETKIWCHILSALNLDGGGVLGFLQIQHYGPVVFDDLLEKFKAELLRTAEKTEAEEIDKAKKGSRSRSTGATGSKSPKTSGANTPASSKATPGKTR